jgi:hypothetical protein
MNLDRSKTIGASATYIVMGGWNTKQFAEWWGKKITPELYEGETPYRSIYMGVGTLLEEHIIRKLNETEDEEIKKADPIDKGVLVVNIDGISKNAIYEIKTMKYEKFLLNKLDRKHVMQVNVQMYASGIRDAYIVQYGVLEQEYDIEYCLSAKIDTFRLKKIRVRYDEEFISEYLRRLEILKDCLKRKVFPDEV